MACDPQIRRKMKSEWKMLFEDAVRPVIVEIKRILNFLLSQQVLDAKLFPLLYPDDLYAL